MLPSIFGESLFDDWMDFPFRGFSNDVDHKLYGKNAARVMKTDLKEHDEGYELFVDLPGFKKDQISLQLQGGYLTITASKGPVPCPEASISARAFPKKTSRQSLKTVF